MDNASLLGMITGLSLIVISILLGGDLGAFVNGPGMMIVIGGTIGTALGILTFTYFIRYFNKEKNV